MFWNNSIEQVTYPSNSDILFKATHNGRHCLYYDPAVDLQLIYTNQTLSALCDLANSKIKQGLDSCFNDPGNTNWLANIVKINLWVHDLPISGNAKPMLLVYSGHKLYNFKSISGTGSSRLKALERVPGITHVQGFITTSREYQHKFQHLELITNFNRFAELCQAQDQQNFWFRLTDDQADYGVDWYEFDHAKTAVVTPSESACLCALKNYLQQTPTTFTPKWFDQKISWNLTL